MTIDTNLIQPCGEGWCVKTPVGIEGPLDTPADAVDYVVLLNRVSAARSELACQDTECA